MRECALWEPISAQVRAVRCAGNSYGNSYLWTAMETGGILLQAAVRKKVHNAGNAYKDGVYTGCVRASTERGAGQKGES